MQQVKCTTCETTKFFTHIINGIPLITCVGCGAQFTMQSPQVPVKQPEVVQEPRPETTPRAISEPISEESFEQKPELHEATTKEEFQEKTGDKVQGEKPIATKIPTGLTPEEKEEYIEKLKRG